MPTENNQLKHEPHLRPDCECQLLEDWCERQDEMGSERSRAVPTLLQLSEKRGLLRSELGIYEDTRGGGRGSKHRIGKSPEVELRGIARVKIQSRQYGLLGEAILNLIEGAVTEQEVKEKTNKRKAKTQYSRKNSIPSRRRKI